MFREAIEPYLLWIKLGVLALALIVGLLGGCTWQANRDDAAITQLKADVKAKAGALDNAATALHASAAAIREINAEADRRVAQARQEADAFAQAGKVADAAKQKAEQNAAALARQIADAKAKRPDCAALMTLSLEAACGISPR